MFPQTTNLLESYRSLEAKNDIFKYEENEILLPVNINLIRFYKNFWGTYTYIYNFKYKDKYVFDDKLFIYDPKIGFNREKKSLLEDLRRAKEIEYYKKIREGYEYQDGTDYDDKEYLRKTDEHVDWTDNGYGLKLSDILKLKPDHSETFKPADKYIYLDYDHKHHQKISHFSLYLKPDNEFENLHEYIVFGKLKNNAINVRNLFRFDENRKNTWCLIKDRSLNEEQTAKLGDVEEGYEGICNEFEVNHGDLNTNTPEKWSTPYVSYDHRSSSESGWSEYYQYMMGDYSEIQRLSENLLGKLNKKIWAVDYDNIFRIVRDNNRLLVRVDDGAIPKRKQRDFLKISDLFNFTFTYREWDETKTATFDLESILSGSAEISFDSSWSMYSDFYLTIGLKENMGNENIMVMDGLEKKKYTVKIDQLKGANLFQHHIHVGGENIGTMMSSQFWKDSEMVKFFHLVSENKRRKVQFTESFLKKMKVKRIYDDVGGNLKIKFTDFLTGREREISWDGMGKIPTQYALIASGVDGEEVKSSLKEKGEFKYLPQYFWDSLEFTPLDPNDFWKTHMEQKIIYRGPNREVKGDWERLIKSKINLFNDLNFHTESLIITEEMANGSVRDLFKSKDIFGKDKPLSSDLLFTKISRDENSLKVSVSVNNEKIRAKREFDFRIAKNLEPAIAREEIEKASSGPMTPEEGAVGGEKNDSYPFNLLTENSQKIMAGAGCALAGGGITSFYPKISSFFRRGR